MPSFLSVGFAPTAALVTWQLQLSGQFETFTYWPTHTVQFDTEMFGSHRFQPNQLDLNSAEPTAFDFVLLHIPSLKDVERMVRKIHKFVSKQSIVLVNTSDGIGSVQRLVRAHLPKINVAAFICDFTTRHIPNTTTNQWQVLQWGNAKSSGPQMAVHIEPVAPKLIAPLEQALNYCKLTTSRQKSSAAFLALQWERNIFCVFELLSVVFGCASIDKLVADPLAKPVIEGVVSELLSLAAATGVKSLPSSSKFLQQGPFMTRKAPSIFAIPGSSRLFYEFYERSTIPLDMLLLVNILLAEEKKMRMPYLESIYAVSTRLQQLNFSPGDLFCRADLEAKQRLADRDSPDVSRQQREATQAATQAVREREEQLAAREQQLAQDRQQHEQERQAYAQQTQDREQQLTARARELQNSASASANIEARMQQIKAREDQLGHREEALQEQTRRLELRERDLERARAVKPISRAGSSTQLFEMHGGAQRRGSTGGARQSIGSAPPTPQTPVVNGYHPAQGHATQPHAGHPGISPQTPLQPGYSPQTHPMAGPQGGAPPGPRRRPNHGPPISYNTHAQLKKSPQQQLLPAELDMISLTQKPRRQSLRTGSMAGGSSMRSVSMTSISNGPHSQQFQLDGIVGLASQAGGYSLASKPRNSAQLSADHTFQSNRPFAHGSRARSYVGAAGGAGGVGGYAQGYAQGSRTPDFSNFNYSYDQKPESSESYSGGSKTPPRSPSVTPPTPNTLDPDKRQHPLHPTHLAL